MQSLQVKRYCWNIGYTDAVKSFKHIHICSPLSFFYMYRDLLSTFLHILFFSSYQFAATVGDIEDILATHYIFSYGTGSPIPMSTNSTPHMCTSSSCQHTFRAPSHHVQQYTVSVAARNVIGVGNASTPVTVGM